MRYSWILFVIFISLLIHPTIPSTTAQEQTQTVTLPSHDWYAVVWNPADDTLNWLTVSGTQATTPRPMIVGEAGNPPRIMINPDGRSMVMIVDMTDGRQSIGFYQFATGEYSQIHQTQLGEYVAEYHPSVFYDNRVALTLATSQTWRIISFDAITGDPVDILNHNAPLAGVLPNISAGAVPYLVHHTFDSTLNSHAIHFQIATRQNLAFVWYPEAQSLEPSDLSNPDADIRYNTTDALFTFMNMTYPYPPANVTEGMGNAIGNGEPINPVTIYADGNTLKSSPRWLAGGAWVGFYGQSASQQGWYLFANDGQSIASVALGSDIFNIVGTPNGFLAVHTDGRITHTTEPQTPIGLTIYQPEIWQQADNLPQIVGLTPRGVRHALTQIETFRPADQPVAHITVETFIPECDGTPESRIVIGDQVSVISGVPLKMRNVAGGNQVAEIPIHTTGQVINGAVCVNGFIWWQIRWALPNGQVLEGWSAEGNLDEYFLSVSTDAVSPTDEEEETTPILEETTPVPLPTLPQMPYIPPDRKSVV